MFDNASLETSNLLRPNSEEFGRTGNNNRPRYFIFL